MVVASVVTSPGVTLAGRTLLVVVLVVMMYVVARVARSATPDVLQLRRGVGIGSSRRDIERDRREKNGHHHNGENKTWKGPAPRWFLFHPICPFTSPVCRSAYYTDSVGLFEGLSAVLTIKD